MITRNTSIHEKAVRYNEILGFLLAKHTVVDTFRLGDLEITLNKRNSTFQVRNWHTGEKK